MVMALPCLDFVDAMERFENDREFYFELVGEFLGEVKETFAGIERAIENCDGKELQSRAHSVKSALGNLGAKRAYQLAYELEVCGKSSRMESAPAHFEQLQAAMDGFAAEVVKYKAA